MKKREVIYNKMMLGFLTVMDVRKFINNESEISLGKHWLPLYGTRVSGKMLGFSLHHMQSVWPEPDIAIPLDTIVKIEENTIIIILDSRFVHGKGNNMPNRIPIRIRVKENLFEKLSVRIP